MDTLSLGKNGRPLTGKPTATFKIGHDLMPEWFAQKFIQKTGKWVAYIGHNIVEARLGDTVERRGNGSIKIVKGSK